MFIIEHLPQGRLLVSCQQALMVTRFPSVLQLLPEFSGRPSTNLIPSQMNADQQARSGERGAVELTTKYTNHTKSISRKRAVQRAQGKRWGEAYWQAGSDRVNAGRPTRDL
jgi:hypothetical protein